MASIYLRGTIWWITYRHGGKNVCESLHTENAREAAEISRSFEARLTNGLVPKPSRTPIGPFLQACCEFWRRTRPGKGTESDVGRLRNVFGQCCPALQVKKGTAEKFKKGRYPVLPVRRLEDLSNAAVAGWLHDRVKSGQMTGKTANNYRAALSSMFAYAREYHGYICQQPDFDQPIAGVDRFDDEDDDDREIIWLRSEQIQQQLDALTEYPAIRALVATYIYAGLRRAEALWLTTDDVDLDRRVIRVRAKTVDGDSWRPKTRKNRTVPISPKLLAELTAYLPLRDGIWFFCPPQERRNGRPRWNPDYFSEYLREINKAKGLPWSCIEFRHTFGSHLAQKGISLYKISELMGNSPDICRKHYAALMPQEMHDEVEF